MVIKNDDNISIYECKDGRTRVYLKNEKRVISYPRYLMEQTLGRQLKDNEQVHHKDGNPVNNDLNNLEVIPISEHLREHAIKYHDKIMTCPWCEKSFTWTAKQQIMFYSNQKRREYYTDKPFCSKQCVGKYGAMIQNANKI
jgi:endogenous inhibitor of DNA gyrase (YacG/DUF329 family)